MDASGLKFAVVESRWNDYLTSRLTEGAVDTLRKHGADEDSIEIFKVPGSFELSAAAAKIAAKREFDAIICLGVVIRGETPHFDYVAGSAASGIAKVSIDFAVPVMFGVITADTVEQALNRAGLKAGNKGIEAATAAIEMANLYKEIGDGKDDKAFPHAV